VVSDEVLRRIEGLTGQDGDRGEDVDLARDSGLASADHLDLIALMRTHAPD